MLNKDGQRELAYVAVVDEIRPIEGKDRVECAVIGGWTIMVKKGQFNPGDLGIYFEIDSKVPPTEVFEFLAPKKFKIKTQKYGAFYSQGLLMHPDDFGWEYVNGLDGLGIKDNNDKVHFWNDESRFLTSTLGVTYAVAEDNKRKNEVSKYHKMIQRMGKKAKRQPYKWLLKRDWGKKLLFIFYGKNTNGWPEWVSKTDEERVENMSWILENKDPWIATEKIDGTSTTFTMKRGKFGKYDFYVCSRNVCFDDVDRQCYYGTNVYLEMADKYSIETHMKDMLNTHSEWDWITIQGETYGEGIQKNDYGIKEHRFAAFNLITSDVGRWNTEKMAHFLETYDIPCVPILNNAYILPDTIEELREYVHNTPSVVHEGQKNKLREGIVFRSQDAVRSFKCVDPAYLIKYHSGNE